MPSKSAKDAKDTKDAKDEKQEKDEEAVKSQTCCAQRWILTYTGFFGFVMFYALRINFSVAIVCMVRPSNRSSKTSSFHNTTNDITNHVTDDDTCGNIEEASLHERGELDWDVTTRSAVLSSFFYGYILLGIPGGWLSDRYGGKMVLGTSMLIASILTLLTPICARTHVYLVYAIRVSVGLAQALVFPSMHSMWAKWAPPLERSKLTGFCYSGGTVGNVAAFSMSGLLCAYGFDNGWGSIFYIQGMAGCIWTAAWFYLTASEPLKHPRITNMESNYIIRSINDKSKRKPENVPWMSIAKSPCVWALLCAHVCHNWIGYTLILLLPTFMKDVLKFDIKRNGVLSALPFIGRFVSAIAVCYLADVIRIKNLLSTTNTRKVMQITANVGSAVCLIATGYCTCDTRIAAVVLLTIAVAFSGIAYGGFLINHVDFAPRYAGMLLGITNFFATIPGMATPVLAGYLTPNNTAEEWRQVFFVCAGFAGFGSIVFGTFASGELQEWANDHSMNMEINVEPKVDKSAVATEATTDCNHFETCITYDAKYDKNGIVPSTKKVIDENESAISKINEGMTLDDIDVIKINEDTANDLSEFGKSNKFISAQANRLGRIYKGMSCNAND